MRVLTLRRKEDFGEAFRTTVPHTKMHKTLQVPVPGSLGPVTPEEARLLEKLDLTRLPRHVAVIMDGNGRWAQKRHLPRTAGNQGMVLCVALNYGGRAEIVDAMNAILSERNGHGTPTKVTEEQLSRHLYTDGLPDPDLLIRTSGEMRVSNFLLWQIAYAEIFVTETLWPDFNRARLLEALLEYQKRERRYGGIREDEPSDEKPARAAGN